MESVYEVLGFVQEVEYDVLAEIQDPYNCGVVAALLAIVIAGYFLQPVIRSKLSAIAAAEEPATPASPKASEGASPKSAAKGKASPKPKRSASPAPKAKGKAKAMKK